ncbi:MAG: hypothetical protein WD966_06115 [Nitrosopumilaceae archaeon]
MKIDPFTAFLVTYGLAELYERLSPQIQQRIKQIFNLHHGTIGAIIEIIGLLKGNNSLMSTGAALMLHDGKDAPLWIQDIERIVDSLARKIDQIIGQQNQQPHITQARYYLPNRF